MYDVFSLPDIFFQDGFLWGSATAGHQIEGDNIHSQIWVDEHSDKFWSDDPKHSFKAPSDKACDSYRLYREDSNLIANLGHKGYRMSIEWSRIESDEGSWNMDAVNHYIDLLARLKESGIQPWVTLHHVTHPNWFEKLGGFRNLDNFRYIERYLKFLLPLISQFVSGWNIINEFNLYGGVLPQAEAGEYKFNMMRFHALGYHIIKGYSTAPVGSAHAFIHWFPLRCFDDLDKRMTNYADYVTNEFFFHALRTGEMVFPYQDCKYDPDVKGALDYWSVNYYTRHMIDSRKALLNGERHIYKILKMIPMDFYLEEMFPEGLTANIERLKDYPVYITENGCSTTDDRFRIVYIALHLAALKEAIKHGVDVRGYFYWSLMDNYEWGSFIPRFGLVDVDFNTYKRTPKPSAYFYRDIIKHNGFTKEILQRYLHELPTIGKNPN